MRDVARPGERRGTNGVDPGLCHERRHRDPGQRRVRHGGVGIRRCGRDGDDQRERFLYASPFLPTATYFAYTTAGQGLLDEFFNDLPCPPEGCTAQVAPGSTPIIGAGSVRIANFDLQPGGSISGTVRSSPGGAQLANVAVAAFLLTGPTASVFAGVAATGALGTYSIGGLASGTYLLFTDGPPDLVDQFFGGVSCLGNCSPFFVDGVPTPVAVTAGAATTNRNFTLAVGGQVSGRVTDAGTGAPLAGVSVGLRARTEIGTLNAGQASTDASGNYTVSGLPTGTYFGFTNNNLGYVDELFDGLPCPGGCLNAVSATDIAVSLGATTTGRNFALARGGSISGTVRNAGTAAPLSQVFVQVHQKVGQSVTNVGLALTNGAGLYTVTGLPTGTYFLSTGNSQGFVDEIYDNVPCPGGCGGTTAATQGQPVAVVAGATTAGRDFGLTVGGQITGVVTDAATAAPLANVTVIPAVDGPGGPQFLNSVNTTAGGAFAITGLSAGTYYLVTFNSAGFVNEVFNAASGGVPCVGSCTSRFAVDTGTAITVATGATVGGKNMALATGGRLTGIVTDAVTQTRLRGVNMRLFANVGGTAVFVSNPSTDALGQYRAANLPTGQYFLASNGSHATQHVNEIFDNLPCTAAILCDPAAVIATGTPIGVTAGATTSRNVALSPRQEPPGPPAFLRAKTDNFQSQFFWTAPTSGGVATSYLFEAGLAPGTTIGSLGSGTTSLTIPGVPPGRFFVRVRGLNAFGLGPPTPDLELVVGANGASPPGAPESLVAIVVGNDLTMTWSASKSGGAATAHLVEAGTASGLANIGALPVSGRTFSVPSVPNGFYFLRVRGLNALGAGPASNEVLLRVGGVPSPPDGPFLSTPVIAAGTVTLTWTTPLAGPVTHYVIEAGTASGLANLAAFNTGNTLTTLSFGGAPPGTYFLRVRAANAQGVSIVANEVILIVP